VVFALDVLHSGSIDSEDRHASTVRALHLHAQELSASDETQRSEEEVIGLNHGFASLLFERRASDAPTIRRRRRTSSPLDEERDAVE